MSKGGGIGEAVGGFLKKYVVDGEEKPEEDPPVAPVAKKIADRQSSPRISAIPAEPPPVPNPSVDKAAREKLEKALAEEAPDGYRDFMDTVSTLAEDIPDERVRFKQAIKLAAKRGTTPEHLLGDFDAAIGILEKRGRAFKDRFDAQVQSKVGSKQTLVANLDGQIKQKHDQLAALEQEIQTLQEQRDTEAGGIENERQKLVIVQQQFTAAHNAVHSQVKAARDKVAEYGKVSS